MHTHSPTRTHREFAKAQMLNSVWLEADAYDVGFAAHVSYLAESLTMIHDFDLSIGHVPTQRFTDDWLDYIEDRLAHGNPYLVRELAQFCDVCGFTWPPDERCPFH